jgi:hypothetical protein
MTLSGTPPLVRFSVNSRCASNISMHTVVRSIVLKFRFENLSLSPVFNYTDVGDKIEKNEMGVTSNSDEGGKMVVQGFGGDT